MPPAPLQTRCSPNDPPALPDFPFTHPVHSYESTWQRELAAQGLFENTLGLKTAGLKTPAEGVDKPSTARHSPRTPRRYDGGAPSASSPGSPQAGQYALDEAQRRLQATTDALLGALGLIQDAQGKMDAQLETFGQRLSALEGEEPSHVGALSASPFSVRACDR